MDYACPVWRFASCSDIRKRKVLHSKCLRIVTNDLWYIGNRQIHNDLGVPYFTDHIISLTYSTNRWCGEPLSYTAWQTFSWPSVDLILPKHGDRDQLVLATWKMAMWTHWIVHNWYFLTTLTEVFPCFSLSCTANIRVLKLDRTLPM